MIENYQAVCDESDPAKLWSVILELLKIEQDSAIPTKRVCSHSKPFWNSQLRELSSCYKSALKRFKLLSDPTNKIILEEAQDKLRRCLILAERTWLDSKVEGLNENNGSGGT